MKIDKKRKIKHKTNYSKRIKLLKGNHLRLVVRKTNRYIIIQIVLSKDAQDFIKYSVNTKELLKYGWPKDKQGSLKSLSAGYLGGLLMGKKAKELKERVILDIGLIPSTKGSRIYAVVRGVLDSGINIKCDDKILPDMERIIQSSRIGEELFNKIKGDIEK